MSLVQPNRTLCAFTAHDGWVHKPAKQVVYAYMYVGAGNSISQREMNGVGL